MKKQLLTATCAAALSLGAGAWNAPASQTAAPNPQVGYLASKYFNNDYIGGYTTVLGALAGARIGMSIGALGGPAGMVVGAAVGAF